MVSAGTKTGWFMGCGSVLVVTGAILVVFWPSIFDTQLKKMMVLTPTSQSFDMWREIPLPMYLECFFFNITNVEDILAKKADKLTVEQLGPYVFRESHTKTNITFNDNATVTFYNKRVWHFEPEMSNGSLSDLITSINPVVATVAYFMRRRPTAINVLVDIFMRGFHENPFVTANASSWLFEGIEDPIIKASENIPYLPIAIPFDRFGWFYERNGSMEYDGIFVMNTGSKDFSQLGNIELWRHSNRTVYREECGEVQGSTGELWAPEYGQPEVSIFAPDICTYLHLAINETVSLEGIEGVKYAANDSIFDNGYNYESKACYCEESRDRDCLPPGALNVSLCRYGAPAFVSLPHFYNADPYYPSKVDGMEPDPSHNFELSLEMFTGMPLSVRAQLQINLLVRAVPGISLINVLPDEDMLVPMFWFRQEVAVNTEYAAMARMALNFRYKMPIAFYGLTVIGVVLLLAGVIVLIRHLMKSPETAGIIEQEEPSGSQ